MQSLQKKYGDLKLTQKECGQKIAKFATRRAAARKSTDEKLLSSLAV
jgi:hypothetical protein